MQILLQTITHNKWLFLSALGQAFLWAHIHHTFYGSTLFSYFPEGNEDALFIVFLALLSAVVVFLPLARAKLTEKLLEGGVVITCATLGFLANAAVILLGTQLGSIALAVPLVTIYAISFAVLFFAWIAEIVREMRLCGRSATAFMALAAIALCILLTPTSARGTWYYLFFATGGLAISGICLSLVKRASAPLAALKPKRSDDDTASGELTRWHLALAFTAFILIQLLSYVNHAYESPSSPVSVSESPFLYALQFILIFGLAFACLFGNENSRARNNVICWIAFIFILLVFFTLFATIFTVMFGEGGEFNILLLVRRPSRILVFVLLVMFVPLAERLAFVVFGFTFLAPIALAKLAQLLLSHSLEVASLPMQNQILLICVLAIGFGLIVVLLVAVLFLVIRFTTQQHSPEERSEGQLKTANASLAVQYNLTKREEEICYLLSQGHSMQKISELLVISPATVNTHVYRIYRKVGVHSRQEIIDIVGDLACHCESEAVK